MNRKQHFKLHFPKWAIFKACFFLLPGIFLPGKNLRAQTCEIIGFSFANIGACNDNATPSDPSDDFFEVDVDVLFSNSITGVGNSLRLAGGDLIGLESVAAPVGTNITHTFQNVKLRADGQITNFNGFIEGPAFDIFCSLPGTGPAVGSCSSAPPPSCEIIGFSFANISQCNDNGTPGDGSDDFFEVDIDVLYSNSFPPPVSLQIVGTDVVNAATDPAQIGTNLTLTFQNVRLRADGQITNFTGQVFDFFSNTANCSLPGTGPAVNSCNSGGGPCSITNIDFAPGPCDDNGTSDPSDDFFLTDVTVTYVNKPATGNLKFFSLDLLPAGTELLAPVGSIGATSHIFQNVKYRADGPGQGSSATALFTDETGCTRSENVVTTPAPCSFAPPTITCPANLTVSCNSEVPPLDPNAATETHTCPGIAQISVFPQITNETCLNRKTISRFFQVSDQCGQQAFCTQTITVNDQTPPSLTCPPTITFSCASLNPAPNPALVTGVSDNCTGAAPTVAFVNDAISNQTCANRFTTTRTYRATDACGNSATCAQLILTDDQTPPTLTCPPGQTVSCAENVPAANPALVTGLTDNCNGPFPTVTFVNDAVSNQTCENRKTIARTYRATDVCGNSATCIQTISVNDQTPPTITCPAAQNVVCAENVPAPNPNLASASDNCSSGGAPAKTHVGDVVSNQTCANRFTLTRTFRATDACGNSATCSQTITVNDQNAPVFVQNPQNLTVECDDAGNLTGLNLWLATAGGAVVTENCNAGFSFGHVENFTPACGETGVWNAIFTATDVCGNAASRPATFTIVDTRAPVFAPAPKSLTEECDLNLNAAQLAAWLADNGGAEVQDCSENIAWNTETILQNAYPGLCGGRMFVPTRFTATDECGNSNAATAIFSTEDTQPPVFTKLPQSKTVECGPDSDPISEFYDWLLNNAFLAAEDRCGGLEIDAWVIDDGANCENSWWKTYRFEATDECGNRSWANATFQVQDSEAPEIVFCPPGADLLCIDDLPAPDPSKVIAKDNCAGNLKFSLEKIWRDGDGCNQSLMQVRYYYRIEDKCGNATTCIEGFNVRDTTLPVLNLPDLVEIECVDDLPTASNLEFVLKPHVVSCAGRFTIRVLAESHTANSAKFTIRLKNWCSQKFIVREITFTANGTCRPICTVPQEVWGDFAGEIGGQKVMSILDVFDQNFGGVKVGGDERSIRFKKMCMLDLLPAEGDFSQLPPGNAFFDAPACDFPMEYLTATSEVLKSKVAGHALALQANFWYNQLFTGRDLTVRLLDIEDTCLVNERLRRYLGKNTTWQDFLILTNQYLNASPLDFPPDFGEMLAFTLSKLNRLHDGCTPHDPCVLQKLLPGKRPVFSQQIPFEGVARVLPNPATTAIAVQFEVVENEQVRLVLTEGRGIARTYFFDAQKGENQVEVSIADLPSGVYNLTIEAAGRRRQNLRFVKMSE